ncbi:cell cycle checkpoint protein RAD17 isoform X2 [Tamandua tetradactyla]|uniref:cell cycle checkpoint protein RAD17 isoform X2 n=1 Tax=Tamandua tetradactyla TaxID=48850 RepID=UPI0040538E58
MYYGWELSKFIMSKTFLRPKVSSTKVADWVDPSFDDFLENTNISSLTATSLDVNNSNYRRNNVPSTLESSRFPARKRGKLSSSEHIYGLENSKECLSENEPWVDKYQPETQQELAVHKKKIEEVEIWLKAQVLERQPKQGGSILLITGPPGCGKTTTIKILSKEHGIQVQEWINPVLSDFQKDDSKEMSNLESSFRTFPYIPCQSQMAVFKEFLLRATKYNKLQMLGDDLRTDKKIILIEDLPNQFYRDPQTLHEVLRKYVRIGRCPLVFIISDSLSGDNNQRLLFPKEIQEECSISNISFNPVAPTIMMKFLNRIVTIEANKNGRKIIVPDKTSLELLCRGCSGDIRSAINSLQFSSLKGVNYLWPRKKGLSSLKSDAALSKSKQRKKSNGISENQEIQAIGGKDVSLFLFRALGKILYCKRASLTELDSPRLPPHLSEYERDTLLVQPEIRSLLREYSTSVATRGVMHSNRARGLAHCQGRGSTFRPLHKPQWFLISKKYRENCLAAKALFSDFCLPALCLQTQLLPYLALLTIPMRNQAQISFIQDIGRLPLKQHFGRQALRIEPGSLAWQARTLPLSHCGPPPIFLIRKQDQLSFLAPLYQEPDIKIKGGQASSIVLTPKMQLVKGSLKRLHMEALTDREPAAADPDSGDEARPDGGLPAEDEDALGAPARAVPPEARPLPPSPSSGSELPPSQPRAFPAQGDADEDAVIEEWESDGT